MNQLQKDYDRETMKKQVMYEQLVYLKEQLQSQNEIVLCLKEKLETHKKEKLKEQRELNVRNNEAREVRRERIQKASEQRLNYSGRCG